MSRLTIDLSMSLDGYVAGPDPSLQDPLVFQERLDAIDASIMRRKTFGGGSGPWEDDPKASGYRVAS
jgi:hypothetical protein